MATVEDYYSQTSYESKFVKGKNSIPKYWAMKLYDARNNQAFGANKLSQARQKATDKGMNDWSEAELRSFLKANFSKHSDAFNGSSFSYNGTTYTYPDIETASQEELFDIAASLSFIKSNGDKSWTTKSRVFDNFNTQIDEFNAHRKIVQAISTAAPDASVETIEKLLTKVTKDFNAVADFEEYLEKIGTEGISTNAFLKEEFKNAGISSDNYLPPTDPDAPPTDPDLQLEKDDLALNVPNGVDEAQNTLDTNTSGNNNDQTGLEDNPDIDDPDFLIETATGREVVKTTAGLVYRDDNSRYVSPNQTTVSTQIEDASDLRDTATEVVTEALEQSAEGMAGASDINTAYTGGAVNEGVANALGWTRNVLEDGTVQFTDPRTNSVYTLEDDGTLTDNTSGEEAYTEGMLNFEENDFAGAFQDTVNEYLFGSSINNSNFAEYGFTFDEETETYTGPNGQTYTVDNSGTLVDVDGNVLRNQGFLGYQQDLEAAGEQYTTDMTTLRGEYAQAYSEYDAELRPRMGQLDSNVEALNQVAQDAGNTDYYNRLSNLYYEQSRDEVNRASRGAQESLNSMYANAGLDPSSPAYTAAMMDLQKKRSDDLVSSRRQAILDSYSLGNDMLTNRQNALNSAQAGIVTGMNALGNLYDVRVKGLDVDKDMISTIYSGKQNQAAVGISGLNTIAQQQQSGINAERDQFYTNLDLRTGLNNNTLDAANVTADTAGNAAQNATNEYWTGMNWLQTLIDNDFNWQATGAALKTQFPNFDFESELDPDFYQQLFPNG